MEEKIYTIQEINLAIKQVTGSVFPSILVEGEIASINFHNTGNVYLSLKDENSAIDAAIFRNNVLSNYKTLLKEGVKVIAKGAISVYVKNGRYSLNIKEIKVQGQGELYEKFLKLKEKLEKEGLFDDERKRPLPLFPKKIGVVTSPNGAAVKDILSVTQRRYPYTHILIIPALVQGGEEAVLSVISAIKAANKIPDLEGLIVGRGGGSYEELALFNDERIAYTVFQSKIPIISAVGHERDYTIIDFVADKRAATPSQAAEMIVPDKEDLTKEVENFFLRIENRVFNLIYWAKSRLEACEPHKLKELVIEKIQENSQELDALFEKINFFYDRKKEKSLSQLLLYHQSLEKLNPLYILNRNYAIVKEKKSQKVLSSIKKLKVGDRVETTLKDGVFLSEVIKKSPHDKDFSLNLK